MWKGAAVLPASIAAIDYHTGGEPFRIVTEPPVRMPGATVAERRARAIEDPDVQALRAVLCSEPRGHADRYGGFIVPPDDESIVGRTFTGTVLETVDVDGRRAVLPQVTGTAHRTGEHMFSIDPHDPLVAGFVLR